MNRRSEDDDGVENVENYRFNERPADEVENQKQGGRKHSRDRQDTQNYQFRKGNYNAKEEFYYKPKGDAKKDSKPSDAKDADKEDDWNDSQSESEEKRSSSYKNQGRDERNTKPYSGRGGRPGGRRGGGVNNYGFIERKRFAKDEQGRPTNLHRGKAYYVMKTKEEEEKDRADAQARTQEGTATA